MIDMGTKHEKNRARQMMDNAHAKDLQAMGVILNGRPDDAELARARADELRHIAFGTVINEAADRN